jgi:hypothetical protein
VRNFKQQQARMREIGAADYLAGKSIDAFFAVDLPRHTESLRAAYEIGWRATRLDRPTKPSAQMQRVQAEKDAIAILQSAHEEMYREQLELRGLGLMPSARQNLELAISLVWDARKHLEGQKLSEAGLYAGKFFTAERSHETCDNFLGRRLIFCDGRKFTKR